MCVKAWPRHVPEHRNQHQDVYQEAPLTPVTVLSSFMSRLCYGWCWFRASTRFFLGNRDYEYRFEAIHVEDQEDEGCPYEYTGLVYVDEDFIWNRFIESDLTKDKIFSRTQQQYLWLSLIHI